jgi:hypothetical protein
MAHLTDGDIDLIVPGPSTKTLDPGMTDAEIIAYAETVTQNPGSLLTPFEQYAASLLAELQKVLSRMRSQHLLQGSDALEDADGWEASKVKLRLISEIWGYIEVVTTRTGGELEVDDTGNFVARTIGTIANEDWFPISNSRLVSVNAARMGVGHTDSTGVVALDALAAGGNIQTGEEISLCGMFPLHHPVDSEQW